MTEGSAPETELGRATSTEVVIRAGKGRSLSPDEVREAFTRQPGVDILDYKVVTRGILRPRLAEIRLEVTAAVDNRPR